MTLHSCWLSSPCFSSTCFQREIVREGSIQLANYESIKLHEVILRKLHLSLSIFDSWLRCCHDSNDAVYQILSQKMFRRKVEEMMYPKCGFHTYRFWTFRCKRCPSKASPYLDFIGIKMRRCHRQRLKTQRFQRYLFHRHQTKSISVYIAVLSGQNVG